MRIRSLDIVRLIERVDQYPAGTIGAVVSEYPKTALVEVEDPERDLFATLISVPYEALELV